MIKAKDWTIISRNERKITVDNRHFFAVRCSLDPKAGWKIIELDSPLGNGAKIIRTCAYGIETRQLSHVVNNICQRNARFYSPHK